CNRGPDAATLHVLPTIWFRNVWSWDETALRPSLREIDGGAAVVASHSQLGDRGVVAEGATWLFTENDTNFERVNGSPNPRPYVKDGIHDYIVHGRGDAVNPAKVGTKAAAHHQLSIAGGASQTIRLRITDAIQSMDPGVAPRVLLGGPFDGVMAARRREADDFYASVIPASLSADARNVMRQALA